MSSAAARRAVQRATGKAPFFGKWGAYSPKHAEKYLESAWNRGYGQPLLTGRYANFEEATTSLTYYARRWRYDWLRHVAMRVDAQRVPLAVLRRVESLCIACTSHAFSRRSKFGWRDSNTTCDDGIREKPWPGRPKWNGHI